jgi:AbrB family looped-hinge helix DNA binding protein
MKAIRTKLGKGGRVIIPTAFRQNLHLETGDDVILHMEDNVIYLTTAEQALRKLQNKVKSYINTTGQNISLADELIAMRRNEAKCE